MKVYILGLVAIVSLLISIPFSYYLMLGYSSVEYDLSISITADPENEYSIYLPAPVNGHGRPSQVASDLRIIDGNAEISMIESDHGPAIRIDGAGDLELSAKGKDRCFFDSGSDYAGFDLSMENSEQDPQGNWVYLVSNTNRSLKLEFGFKYDSNYPTYGYDNSVHFSGDIQPNWAVYSFTGGPSTWDGLLVMPMCMVLFICVVLVVALIYIALRIKSQRSENRVNEK